MRIFYFILKVLHKLYYLCFYKHAIEYNGYVQFFDQQANDLIADKIATGNPLMVSKFGSVELSALMQHKMNEKNAYTLKDVFDYISMKLPCLWWKPGIDTLCTNAGFFPNDEKLLPRFYDENVEAMKKIDVLGSYLYSEKFIADCLSGACRVNLNGFYAPFLWEKPWTKQLKGLRVLVIHPFADDIQTQYGKRNLIWSNPDVLPEFSLITYKAVQSMLNTKTDFETWFDALNKMKSDVEKINFDIALIGCGAYGMPLAAFVKQMGRQAVHLAGWTQILFGIIGKRWEEDPLVKPFINENWIRPSQKNVPRNAELVEKGCYW